MPNKSRYWTRKREEQEQAAQAPLPALPEPDKQTICLSYCQQFYDYEECRKVCLELSPINRSLFIKAVYFAERAGFSDIHARLFAAGAAWYWSERIKR